MANSFLLKIVTPSHDVYEGMVQRVFLKNSDGEFEAVSYTHLTLPTTERV